jgi:tetratricopeptide (TPR) repeat protein
VNRNDGLFLVIGLLVGFIGGYLMQDVMADRQPPRLVHGEGGVAATGAPMPTEAAAGSAAQARLQERIQEIQSLEARVRSNPDDADALLRLANLSFDVESWSRCIDMYERYLELRPESPDLLSDMGVCYRGIGQLDRALELFHRAQQLDPDHWPSRFNEAVVLGIDRRDFDAAERVVEELRTLQPGDPQIERLAEEIARRRSGGA